MQKIWNDLVSILSSIALVDYILYIAVIILIILVVSLFYIMKMENEAKEEAEEGVSMNDELDLKTIAETIDENPKPLVDMTAYENEQEQKAIISYDELLEKTGKLKLDYEDEKMVDDEIPVKKINVTQMDIGDITSEIKEPPTEHAFFSSYEKEEAFLSVLKQMNELLNG